MSDNISSIAKDLYDKFLMRDLLSFIVPGVIVIISLLLTFVRPFDLLHYAKEIPFLLYIPIFGFCFVIGFFVQCFGALLYKKNPMIKYYSPRWLDTNENVKGDTGNEVTRESKIVCAKRNKKTLDLKDKYKLHWERIAALKQMCGNNAMALLLSLIIYMNKRIVSVAFTGFEWQRIMFLFDVYILLSYIVAIYFLFRGHEEQVEIQMAFEDEVFGKEENINSN